MQDLSSRPQSTSYLSKLSKAILLIVAVLLCHAYVFAAGGPPIAGITIENFGQVDDRLYRGGQPKPDEFRELAALGIKTVIDLRDDSEKYEPSAVQAAGLHYVHLFMNAKRPPTDAQVAEFIKTVEDQTNGKVFVHCAGGRHRTGVMVAVYRFTHYKWSPQQAYDEMKAYDFYTAWGHGAMKDYVFNYKESPAVLASASLTSTSVAITNSQQH